MNTHIMNAIKEWEYRYFIPFYNSFFKNNPTVNASLNVLAINIWECNSDLLSNELIEKYTPRELLSTANYILENSTYHIHHNPTWQEVIHKSPFPGYYTIIAHLIVIKLDELNENVTSLKDILLDDLIKSQQNFWPEYLESILRPTFDDINELYKYSIHWYVNENLYFINLSRSLLYGFNYFRDISIQTRTEIFNDVTTALRIPFFRKWMLRKYFLKK